VVLWPPLALYKPQMLDDGDCGAIGGLEIGRETATLSTTNPTLPYSGSNPGRRGGKPGTSHLSYGMCAHTQQPKGQL
jgi:hypothetical protein